MSFKVILDKDTKKQLDAFRNSSGVVAEEVVFKTFPNKPQQVLELQKLIESTYDASSPFHISHAPKTTDSTVYPAPVPSAEPEPKKRKLDSGDAVNGIIHTETKHAKNPSAMVANKHIGALHEQLKGECQTLAELCDKVKLWINLSMPKIEDGDNFGVQIQEDVLSELHRSQESAYNLRDAARQNYLTRAKICSKIMKYPNLEDYALALKEHDEKQIYVARQNLHDLLSIYAVLTDILHKNIEKIRSPKGNNSSSMY